MGAYKNGWLGYQALERLIHTTSDKQPEPLHQFRLPSIRLDLWKVSTVAVIVSERHQAAMEFSNGLIFGNAPCSQRSIISNAAARRLKK